jgi:hypothetical protein
MVFSWLNRGRAFRFPDPAGLPAEAKLATGCGAKAGEPAVPASASVEGSRICIVAVHSLIILSSIAVAAFLP